MKCNGSLLGKTIQYVHALQDGIAVITFDEAELPRQHHVPQWQDDLDAVTAQVAQGQGRHPRHHPGLRQEHLFRRCRPQGRDAA
jgi:hypothetical protein